MTATAATVSVVIVTYNTREALETCLASVIAAAPAQTVVVDNASDDGTPEMVRTEFPAVQLIAMQRNLGYGGGANAGIAACTAPTVLLLNSDTVVAPDSLSVLARYLAAHPRVGVVGPRLVNTDGSLQRSAYPYPSVMDTILGETGLHIVLRRVPLLRDGVLRSWSHTRARRVPWVLGAALAIRRDAFAEVGGFDGSYFMYGEEVDFCHRLARIGFETHFAPVTTVVHLGGASTAGHWEAMRRELLVSRRRYLLRNDSRRAAARVLGVMRMIAAIRLFRDAVLLPVAADPARRRALRRSARSWRALLTERQLWKP